MIMLQKKRTINKESYRSLSIQMIKRNKTDLYKRKLQNPLYTNDKMAKKRTINKESYRTLPIQMKMLQKKGKLLKKVTEPFLYK